MRVFKGIVRFSVDAYVCTVSTIYPRAQDKRTGITQPSLGLHHRSKSVLMANGQFMPKEKRTLPLLEVC